MLDAAKNEVMRQRIPLFLLATKFHVNCVGKYNAMKAMTIALPNLRQLSLNNLDLGLGGGGHKYSDGEDPNGRHSPTGLHTILESFPSSKICAA